MEKIVNFKCRNSVQQHNYKIYITKATNYFSASIISTNGNNSLGLEQTVRVFTLQTEEDVLKEILNEFKKFENDFEMQVFDNFQKSNI